MPHALSEFLRHRMDELGLRNRDIESASGLSRQLVSKYVADRRESLSRLPDRSTLLGFAKALGVSTDFLLAKAVESMGLGYSSGDFVNTISGASSDELIQMVSRRLREAERDAETLRALAVVLEDWHWEYAARATGEVKGLVPRRHDLEDLEDFLQAANDDEFRRLRAKRGVDPETGAPPDERVDDWGTEASAARETGLLSKGQQRRANADSAGEENQDPDNNSEPL